MNIILFDRPEVELPLPPSDPRARHILDTLRRKPGEPFEVGIINGPRGQAKLRATNSPSLKLDFEWTAEPLPPPPLHLIIGLPRPQTARDILRDATTLGVAAIHFVRTEKGEPSYASSSLWQSGEWRRHLITGASQAFSTQLPVVQSSQTLAEAVATLPATNRIVLDNYESAEVLSKCAFAANQPVTIAIGSERGWSSGERNFFRDQQFTFAHLGTRVLRTETAVVAALTLVKAKLGWL
ncbi:16S rRNA (uracil(1498)-N(3))-methyltransferase [Oleiharenicola lentus]|uniref:16S rRNA (uracil(1498)-N(3))-methyltransferase n=1 Tax=Oleiharenicola lentus TaxID=2508720 RepID=UPI003F672002